MEIIEIKYVTREEASKIIATGKPLGLFYEIDGNLHVGVDNSTGEAWVEEFKTARECLDWLRGDRDLDDTEGTSEEKGKYTYKTDKDKPRLDLVPPAIIEAVGAIRTYGVSKYGENTNWEKVEKHRYRAALIRHLCGYLHDPKSVDEESGLLHLWHMACNIAFLCELEKENK